jgi:hypothetical protein
MNYEELTDKLRELTILEGYYEEMDGKQFAEFCRDFKNPPGICILPNCNGRAQVDNRAKRTECPKCHNYSVVSAPRLYEMAIEYQEAEDF